MSVKGSGRIPTCHPDRKHTAHGMCEPCYDAWYLRKHRGSEKRRLQANARQRKYRLSHPALILARNKVWQKNNPQIMCHHTKLKRGRKRNALGTHTHYQWLERVTYFGWRCVYCKKALVLLTLTKDHKIALSRGGTQWASNLVPACRHCNAKKFTTPYKKWVEK